jgi:hypothetical protein
MNLPVCKELQIIVQAFLFFCGLGLQFHYIIFHDITKVHMQVNLSWQCTSAAENGW